MKTKVETIADSLLESINDGTYASKLPSEKELSSLFKTTPVTAGKALNILRDKGIVARVPGRGTFILKDEINKKITLNLLLRKNSETFYVELWQEIVTILAEKYPSITLNVDVADNDYVDAIIEGKYDFYINFSFMKDELYRYFVPFTGDFEEMLGSNSFYFRNIEFAHRANGFAYGLPYTFSPMVLYVNRTLFKKIFKQNLPESITIEDLLDFAEKYQQSVVDFNVKFLEFFGIANLFNWISGLMLKSENESIFDLSVEEFKKCLRVIKQIYPQTIDEKNSFFTGDFLFRYSNRQLAFKLYGAESKVDFDVIRLACNNLKGSGFANESIFIHKNCENLDIAQKICKEIVSDKVQTFIGKKLLGIPVNKVAAIECIDNSTFRDYLIYDSIKNISAHDAVYSNECLETFMSLLQPYIYGLCDYDNFERKMIKVFEYHKFAGESLGKKLVFEDMFN